VGWEGVGNLGKKSRVKGAGEGRREGGREGGRV